MFLFLLYLAFADDDDAPKPRQPEPTAAQLEYQRAGKSMFIHFGISQFTHIDVGNGTEDPDLFYPEELDTDQWVLTAKKFGFDRIIFTAKHHDGFCLWQTSTTKHSINFSTRFQQKYNNEGDIVRFLRRSCDKYGIKLGIYLSPWDRNASSYGTDEYNTYYKEHLREILTNYGEIYEIWMDNFRDPEIETRPMKYDFLGYFELIKSLQPNCLVASPYASDIRWIGNEHGETADSCWYYINSTYVRQLYDDTYTPNSTYQMEGELYGDTYSMAEVDFSIQPLYWFWSPQKENVRAPDELAQIYINATGHGQIFLMNIPPNSSGVFPKLYVDSALRLGRAINKSFGRNYANQSMAVSASAIRNNDPAYDPHNMLYVDNPEMYWSMNDGMYTGYVCFDFNKTIIFDCVSVVEHLELGQRITKFTIDYEQNGFWKTFASGTSIGASRMFRSKPISAQKLYIKIEDSVEVLGVESFGLYKMQDDFELGQYIPDRISLCENVQYDGAWDTDGENNVTQTVGASATVTFTGSYCSIVGPMDPSYGEMKIYIDGKLHGTVNTSYEFHRDRRELYRIGDISNGEHTVKVECSSNSIGIYNIYSLNNYEIGLFEIASREYQVLKGENVTIEIKRIGGSKTPVSVTVKTDYFTAKDNKHYTPINQVLNFAEGQTSQTVTIQTFNYTEDEDLHFNVVIDDATLGSEIGFNYSAMVSIVNELDNDNDNDNDEKIFLIAGIILAAVSLVVLITIIIIQIRTNKKPTPLFKDINTIQNYT